MERRITEHFLPAFKMTDPGPHSSWDCGIKRKTPGNGSLYWNYHSNRKIWRLSSIGRNSKLKRYFGKRGNSWRFIRLNFEKFWPKFVIWLEELKNKTYGSGSRQRYRCRLVCWNSCKYTHKYRFYRELRIAEFNEERLVEVKATSNVFDAIAYCPRKVVLVLASDLSAALD